MKRELEDLARQHYTINMEYTSPSNRIVIAYARPQLTILSIRSHLNGETLFASRLSSFLGEHKYHTLLQYMVQFRAAPNHFPQKEFVESIRQEIEGEGYVVEIIPPDRSPYLIKIKTNKYLLLHQSKDSLNNPRSVFESVINEQSDDLRSLLHNDTSALKIISNMEERVRPIFNRMIQCIEQFYNQNKHLPRKEFALLVTNTPSIKIYMPLLMRLHSGQDPNYKQFALNHAKDLFGIHVQNICINNENDDG